MEFFKRLFGLEKDKPKKKATGPTVAGTSQPRTYKKPVPSKRVNTSRHTSRVRNNDDYIFPAYFGGAAAASQSDNTNSDSGSSSGSNSDSGGSSSGSDFGSSGGSSSFGGGSDFGGSGGFSGGDSGGGGSF